MSVRTLPSMKDFSALEYDVIEAKLSYDHPRSKACCIWECVFHSLTFLSLLDLDVMSCKMSCFSLSVVIEHSHRFPCDQGKEFTQFKSVGKVCGVIHSILQQAIYLGWFAQHF